MQRNPSVSIRQYKRMDEDALFALIMREGGGWEGYCDAQNKPKYQKALAGSVTYLIFENDLLCGFARCRLDDELGIYVYDLLVDKGYRGKEYGRLLLEQVCSDYPDEEAYVMSDVDGYYNKLGYEKEGTIFAIHKR